MFQDLLNNTVKSKRNSHAGFTLLEIVLSIVIFGIMTLSLSLPFCQSIRLSSNDQDIADANNLVKLYFGAVESKWQRQSEFDLGTLPGINSTYTNNGDFNVELSSENLALNKNNIPIVRRVNLVYKKNNKIITDVFSDFNRPVASIK